MKKRIYKPRVKRVYCRGHYEMTPCYQFNKGMINKAGDKGICRQCVKEKENIRVPISELVKSKDCVLRHENQMKPIKPPQVKERGMGDHEKQLRRVEATRLTAKAQRVSERVVVKGRMHGQLTDVDSNQVLKSLFSHDTLNIPGEFKSLEDQLIF